MPTHHPTAQPIVYATIPGYSRYRAGTDGSVWSNRRGEWRLLRGYADEDGYLYVGVIDDDGIRKKRPVHQLILETFVGTKSAGMECRHFPDPDPGNNHIGNLRWGTRHQNEDDKKLLDRTTRGTRCPHAKLTDDDIPVIRSRAAAGENQSAIGADYGVSQFLISQIHRRKKWAHVP